MKESARRLSWVGTLALLQLGCGTGEGSLGWLWSLGGSLVLSSLLWTSLFAGLGLTACLPCCWIVRRFGWPKARGLVAQLARMSALAVVVFVLPFTFAYIGFFEGVLRGATHQLKEGDVVDEIYPLIGGVGADFVGTAYLVGERRLSGGLEFPDSTALTSAFRNGDVEIESARVPEVLAHLEGEVVDDVAREVKRKARETLPILREGAGKGMLDWFVDHCSQALRSFATGGDPQEEGLGSAVKLFRRFVERLPEAAGREGDPNFLSHDELSSFIVESTLAEGLLKVLVRPFCRGQQILALGLVFVFFVFPAVVLAVVRLIARLGAARSPDAGPPA